MKYLLPLIVIIFFVRCSEKQEYNAIAIEIEVREMFNAYDDSVRKKGIEGEFFFLDKSEAFYWVPPGHKYALHYDSISRILKEYAPNFKYINNSWDTLEVLPLSDEYASFNGVINSYAISSNNDTTITKLSETGLVVKRKTGWKFLNGQTVVVGNE